jgi:WD40 repeat protein
MSLSASCGATLTGVNSSKRALFHSHQDIGDVGSEGSVTFEDSVYTVTGSGQNMWFGEDALHYVWTKVDGDVSLHADVAFVGLGEDAHRKACLVIRQTLEPGSVYADIAVHGDGLTSLQYRASTGAVTQEVQSNVTAPTRVGIERRGKYISATVDGKPSGGSVRLELTEPFYIGLAVCSHRRGTTETAVFSNVELGTAENSSGLVSTLETIDIASTDRRTVHVFDQHMEAPNWTADDRLIFNSKGRLFAIPAEGGEITPIDTDFAVKCNNDHGLSPDGTRIAISDQSQGDGGSRIYTLPIGGGTPTLLTDDAPSYWHGWSPDGATIAFCGQRDGLFGIFTIPAEGGPEARLTTAIHLDDGPEYSPDGQWIYFNSDRTGLMQIWRMHADGEGLEQVTDDDTGNWFPHLSPDGSRLSFLAYEADVDGHPADKDVELKLLDVATGAVTTLARLFGGQGTINVPSWSPDSKRLAFVSYAYL